MVGRREERRAKDEGGGLYMQRTSLYAIVGLTSSCRKGKRTTWVVVCAKHFASGSRAASVDARNSVDRAKPRC